MLDFIFDTLQQHTEGISEYQLIQALRQYGYEPFCHSNLQDPQSLFVTHFTLFHVLHRLKNQLLAQQQASLDIHSLCIRIVPWQPGTHELSHPDPLRDYYLNTEHLHNTDLQTIEALLHSGQMRLLRRDEALQALEQLGFPIDSSIPDAQEIRLRYRQLASKHHPDRGGDTEVTQALNQAFELLKQLGYLD